MRKTINNRLLCIVSSMDTGGAETFLMKMYRHLDKTMYQMDFIAATTKEGYYDHEIKELGGKVFNIPLHSKHPIKAFQEVKRIVKEGGYINVLKILASPIGVIDLYAAKAGGAYHLCARSCNSLAQEGITRKCLNTLCRIMLCRISTVKLAPSDLAARYTFGESAYKRNEVVMLHNALDLELFHFSETKRKKIRDELGLGDSFVIGHVGRFVQQKNHMFLIKVFKRVLESKSNAKLVLVGTGALQKDVQRYCNELGLQDKVLFAGVRDDVPSFLSAFDLFVLPSFFEGMPNTCIEAQASGLRCLIADSITKEADITGNVEFLPITDISIWCESIVKRKEIDREAVNAGLIGSDYDINKEINFFIKNVFADSKRSV